MTREEHAIESVRNFCKKHGIHPPLVGQECLSPLYEVFVDAWDIQQDRYDQLGAHTADLASDIEGLQYNMAMWQEQLAASRKEERERAVSAVMDLFYALREIKGRPKLLDLVKLAKRIRRN